LPGLNSVIDPFGSITREFLNDMPIIDLVPASYSISLVNSLTNGLSTYASNLAGILANGAMTLTYTGMTIFNNFQITNDLEDKDYKSASENTKEMDSASKNADKYQEKFNENVKNIKDEFKKSWAGLTSSNSRNKKTSSLYSYDDSPENISNKTYHKILDRYFEIIKSKKVNSKINLKEVLGLRIIGANDTIYTDSIQNGLNTNQLLNTADSMLSSLKIVQKTTNLMGGLTKLDYGSALSFFTSAQSGVANLSSSLGQTSNTAIGTLANLVTGKMLGVNIAFPKVYENSSYTNSFNLTIKLTSPTGHPDDIREYIQKPILMLLVAGSPISGDGVSYGFPLAWKVRGHGIADAKICYIENISVIRGSLDNHYSDFLQPINIDVRITLAPINSAFVSIFADEKTMSIDDEKNIVGVQTPYDLAESFHENYRQTIDSNDNQPEIITINL
jgi:hypothetical protein